MPCKVIDNRHTYRRPANPSTARPSSVLANKLVLATPSTCGDERCRPRAREAAKLKVSKSDQSSRGLSERLRALELSMGTLQHDVSRILEVLTASQHSAQCSPRWDGDTATAPPAVSGGKEGAVFSRGYRTARDRVEAARHVRDMMLTLIAVLATPECTTPSSHVLYVRVWHVRPLPSWACSSETANWVP